VGRLRWVRLLSRPGRLDGNGERDAIPGVEKGDKGEALGIAEIRGQVVETLGKKP